MTVGSPDILVNVISYTGILLGFANVGLVLGLIHVYWESYKELKSKYTLGLLFFALIFLLQSVFLVGVVLGASLVWKLDVETQIAPAVLAILEFIGLAILLKVSWD